MPASVSTSRVTIGRVPSGFSAAPASGSSAGSRTRWERVAVIFMRARCGWGQCCEGRRGRRGAAAGRAANTIPGRDARCEPPPPPLRRRQAAGARGRLFDGKGQLRPGQEEGVETKLGVERALDGGGPAETVLLALEQQILAGQALAL